MKTIKNKKRDIRDLKDNIMYKSQLMVDGVSGSLDLLHSFDL